MAVRCHISLFLLVHGSSSDVLSTRQLLCELQLAPSLSASLSAGPRLWGL